MHGSSWQKRYHLDTSREDRQKDSAGFYSHRSEFSKREIHGWFLDDHSEVRILVATEAVGMGMDFPNVEV